MTSPTIILSRELRAMGMERELRARLARGTLRRIRHGVYVETSEYEALTADERYRLDVAAVAHLLPRTQFSRDSAAALWRLPSLGPWPLDVHAASPRSEGGRSGALVRRHGVGLDPRPAVIDGVTVTSLTRTLAEMACDRSFPRAVVALDSGLRTPEPGDFRWGTPAPTREEVLTELATLGRLSRSVTGLRAIAFADGASGSPGESLSRTQIHALGLPAPELQVEFHDHRGVIGTVDFYWRHLGLVGEFDGHSKYGDKRRFARHLTAAEVLIAEKDREDRLRAVVDGLVRWDWATARDRRALAAWLARHGLVP